jgi:hypothetical protein
MASMSWGLLFNCAETMDRKHEKYERLIERAKALPPLPTAVAHPCD